MNFILIPSLRHIALVKIAITLWTQDDISTRIKKYIPLHLRNKKEKRLLDIDDKGRKEWFKIEERVFKKVTQLKLAKCLEEKLFGVVKPIGLELLIWVKDHNRGTYAKFRKLLYNLCWTSLGKIDNKKSAEVIMKDKSVHIAVRFIVACINCLEDDVRELWNSMPKNMKAYFYSEAEENVLDDEVNQLVVIWTYYLKGNLAKLTEKINDFFSREIDFMSKETSVYQFGFTYAVRLGNKPATEYFLKKLNPAEREECLMNYECEAYHGDVCCFLLSQMNEKEQIMYFNTYSMYSCSVLGCLLEWPFQSLVKETFVTLCELDLIPAMEFYVLLGDIMKKISESISFKDYNYKELLEQIWLLSPEIYKDYVFYYWADQSDVPLVSDMANEGNIMLILKDAPIEMKEKIIFSHVSCILSLVYKYKWDTVRLLMQECISSTEMILKFKKEVKIYCDKTFYNYDFKKESEIACRQRALDKFSELFDELINKKRNLEEEGECSQAKKPYIIKLVKSTL